MEEYWSSAISLRNLSSHKESSLNESGIQILRFYIVGQIWTQVGCDVNNLDIWCLCDPFRTAQMWQMTCIVLMCSVKGYFLFDNSIFEPEKSSSRISKGLDRLQSLLWRIDLRCSSTCNNTEGPPKSDVLEKRISLHFQPCPGLTAINTADESLVYE